MIYSDAHLHVNPVSGLGADRIARKFKSEGGWFISIVSLPPYHYGYNEVSIDSYRKVIELINREAIKAKSHGLTVARFMGFHPAEIDHYYRLGVSPSKLMRLVDDVVRLIEDALRDGLIDGVGEMGRQHYGTSTERLVFSEIVMVRLLSIARDYGVPVQLHLEQGGLVTAYSIKLISSIVGLHSSKVIIHHANMETATWAEHLEMPFTAPVKQFNDKYASLKWRYCMIESDFIDDPSRPGVSAYPWEIPEVIESHVRNGVLSEEDAYRILVDNITRFFGVKPP